MVFFRPRRDRRGPDRFLSFKMVVLVTGGMVAFAGIALDLGWLINVAIVILLLGLALNLRRPGRQPTAPPDDDPSG